MGNLLYQLTLIRNPMLINQGYWSIFNVKLTWRS